MSRQHVGCKARSLNKESSLPWQIPVSNRKRGRRQILVLKRGGSFLLIWANVRKVLYSLWDRFLIWCNSLVKWWISSLAQWLVSPDSNSSERIEEFRDRKIPPSKLVQKNVGFANNSTFFSDLQSSFWSTGTVTFENHRTGVGAERVSLLLHTDRTQSFGDPWPSISSYSKQWKESNYSKKEYRCFWLWLHFISVH